MDQPVSPQIMSKPGDPASAVGSSASVPGRQHQSHPEETEEELREHQGLSSSSSSPSSAPVQETRLLRAIKQEPPDPEEQEDGEQRDRHSEQDFLFKQVMEDRGHGFHLMLPNTQLCQSDFSTVSFKI